MGRHKKDPTARPAIEAGIPERIVDIILENLAIDEDELTLDTKLVDDLAADSLDLVELSMAFEAHYGLAIDDAVIDRWVTGTVGDLVADLRKLGAHV